MKKSFNFPHPVSAVKNLMQPNDYQTVGAGFTDLGTHTGEYFGKPTSNRKAMLSFECFHADGTSFVHNQIITQSTNSKSTLRKYLDGLNGTPFTREAIKEIGPEWMLGRAGVVTLDYANEHDERLTIVSIRPFDGVAAPKLSRPIVFFSLEDPDLEVFAKLSAGVQGMIMKSAEWKALPYADDWLKQYVGQKVSNDPSF